MKRTSTSHEPTGSTVEIGREWFDSQGGPEPDFSTDFFTDSFHVRTGSISLTANRYFPVGYPDHETRRVHVHGTPEECHLIGDNGTLAINMNDDNGHPLTVFLPVEVADVIAQTLNLNN